ncbi:hypothetical protein, partial [uncultured Varibaculum sp.]|uniref:hypothetical protein n=1 Tax=uncultured Varibaculum sp. TaxID=413896 RepID=UPI002590CEBD
MRRALASSVREPEDLTTEVNRSRLLRQDLGQSLGMGSDGLPYEKRVDKKGKVLSETCIQDEVPFEIPNT